MGLAFLHHFTPMPTLYCVPKEVTCLFLPPSLQLDLRVNNTVLQDSFSGYACSPAQLSIACHIIHAYFFGAVYAESTIMFNTIALVQYTVRYQASECCRIHALLWRFLCRM